jgi:hypothetical protein
LLNYVLFATLCADHVQSTSADLLWNVLTVSPEPLLSGLLRNCVGENAAMTLIQQALRCNAKSTTWKAIKWSGIDIPVHDLSKAAEKRNATKVKRRPQFEFRLAMNRQYWASTATIRSLA